MRFRMARTDRKIGPPLATQLPARSRLLPCPQGSRLVNSQRSNRLSPETLPCRCRNHRETVRIPGRTHPRHRLYLPAFPYRLEFPCRLELHFHPELLCHRMLLCRRESHCPLDFQAGRRGHSLFPLRGPLCRRRMRCRPSPRRLCNLPVPCLLQHSRFPSRSCRSRSCRRPRSHRTRFRGL